MSRKTTLEDSISRELLLNTCFTYNGQQYNPMDLCVTIVPTEEDFFDCGDIVTFDVEAKIKFLFDKNGSYSFFLVYSRGEKATIKKYENRNFQVSTSKKITLRKIEI